MKTIRPMIAVVTASFALASSAAMTYDESKAYLAGLKQTDYTASNASKIIEASLMTTNRHAASKLVDVAGVNYAEASAALAECSSAAMLSVAGKMASKCNANVQKVILDKIVAKLVAAAETATVDDICNYQAGLNSILDSAVLPSSERAAAAQKLIAAGLMRNAICTAFNAKSHTMSLAKAVLTRSRDEYLTNEYIDFIDDNFDQLFAWWLNAPISDFKSKMVYEGMYQIFGYAFFTKQDSKIEAGTPKVLNAIKQIKPAHGFFIASAIGSTAMQKKTTTAIRYAMFDYSELTDEAYLMFATIEDKQSKDRAAMKHVYSKLKTDSAKIDAAVYLNDVDKVIDICKSIDSNIQAEKIANIIPMLNSVDAGYRTEDFKLGLMNINKKYTIKLYDDRDTWEPILSKVRAMIDTLQ